MMAKPLHELLVRLASPSAAHEQRRRFKLAASDMKIIIKFIALTMAE